MKAGELREKIIIERPERVQRPDGGFDTTYVNILNTYAKVREIQPRSEVIAEQENLRTLVQFDIRYRTDVNIKIGDRIVWRRFNFTVAEGMKVDYLRTKITITANSEIEETNRTYAET